VPTYRYRCDRCGEQLEAWQSIHDEPLRRHDGDCGGELRKVLGVGGIVLKGSGFYRTDNRSGAKRDKADKSETGSTNGSSSDTKKSDSSSSTSDGSSSSSSSSKTDTPSKSNS
jgi:putative FmdB family regulatory protein